MLLESVCQQLAGESMSSRQDAYMQFLGALKAYEGLPGEQEISEKLRQITQFIQRDISRDLEKGGPFDTNLVICALKLAVTFVWHPEISTRLPDDFKIFLVEQSINSLQNAKLPKSILVHYMHVLSAQNFNAKIMTNARLINLITTLQDLTDRVNGNAIVLQRLSIYQRILTQSKTIFVLQSALWIEHLISGLLHHVKDTRLKAISLGFHTSMALGPNQTLSKNIRDAFERPINKDRKLVSEICERMSRMMGSIETAVHVPQVWSIVILLLRSKRLSVSHWEHFKDWLFILQKCLNCSELAVKTQAILAWNRFVFAVGPNEMTGRPMLKMLGKPILSQLERRRQEKPGTQLTRLALSSYYNLLYYAFRPSVPHQHLDVVWEEYVALPSQFFSSVPALSDRISAAFSSLMWSSQAKVWSENKVNENGKLDPEELPSIDCKWIRSRINSVLNVFEVILKSSVWTDDAVDKSNIAAAWIGLSRALSYASSKEVTPSAESMQAVAAVLGFLRRLWNTGPSSLNAVGDNYVDRFFDRFRFLSTTIIFSIGSIAFTEKLLLKAGDERFQAASTPQHRHSSADNNLDSPILHLLRIISGIHGVSEPALSYRQLIEGILEAACNGRTSRGSRLELLHQCAVLCSSEAESHPGNYKFCQLIWKVTAKFSADCLCSFPIESARQRDGSISRDYENAVRILSSGLTFTEASQEWSQLLDSFVRVLRTEKGDRAIATVVIEPLSERMMLQQARDLYQPSTAFFNHSLSLPYCHENNADMEGNDTYHSSLDGDLFIFPDKLVKLADKILRETYEIFDPSRTNGIADFLEALTSFLGSGAFAFRARVLERIQQPISLWLKDETRKLNAECGIESRVLTSCRALSLAVLNVLQASEPCDYSCLQKFETIICAGLESTHVFTMRRFIETWLPKLESQVSSVYPEAITHALTKLRGLHGKRQWPNVSLSDSQIGNGNQGQRHSDETKGDSITVPDSRPVAALDDPFAPRYSEEFDSSPIVKANGLPAVVPVDKAAKLSPSFMSKTETKQREDHKRRRKVKATESPRPSSGAERKSVHGPFTPPYLCNFHKSESATGTPQTPLPVIAVEKGETFLDSSPTPGTRSRNSASHFEISTPIAVQDSETRFDSDLPSSPPEIRPQNANDHKADSPSRLLRIHTVHDSAVFGNVEDSDITGNLAVAKVSAACESTSTKDSASEHENTDSHGTSEMLKGSTRRLRSSGRNLFSNPNSPVDSIQNGKPASEIKTSGSGAAAKANVGSHSVDHSDYSANLSGDDMEIQIASQLEQDMELAADMNETRNGGLPEVLSNSLSKNKKRKRPAHKTSTAPDAKRRRSSRLASSGVSTGNSPEQKATQSAEETVISGECQDKFISDLSPVDARRRKCETNKDLGAHKVHSDEDAATSTVRRRSLRRSSRIASSDKEESVDNGNQSQREDQGRRTSRRLSRIENKQRQNTLVKGVGAKDDELLESETPMSGTQVSADTDMSFMCPQAEQAEEGETRVTYARISPEHNQPTDKCMVSQAAQTADTEGNIAEADIVNSLKKVLNDVKMMSLDRDALRQIDDLLFDIRVETHEATRRQKDRV